MSGVLGDAVVADFDGTLARLDVAWAELRARFAVDRIDDLWRVAGNPAWEVVTAAEVDAARTAASPAGVVDALAPVAAIAVLTSNDERAVATFLDRRPDLRAKVRIVVGRRALGGPKSDFAVFSAGYEACARALAGPVPGSGITYVGDMRYELDYARRLGAEVFDVKQLEPASGSGEG